MTNNGCKRRHFLYRAGAMITAGALAGCAGGNGSTDDPGSTQTSITGTERGGKSGATTKKTQTSTVANTGTGSGVEMTAGAETTMEADTTTGGATTAGTEDARPVTEPAPKRVDQLLDDAKFYNGNMVVGVSTVAVGAGDAHIGFDPAAIKIAAGTEVTWEWTSGEAKHSVTSVGIENPQKAFGSGSPRAGNETTYRHTFNTPGIYQYVCGIHRIQGAHGVVIVVPGDDIGGQGSG